MVLLLCSYANDFLTYSGLFPFCPSCLPLYLSPLLFCILLILHFPFLFSHFANPPLPILHLFFFKFSLCPLQFFFFAFLLSFLFLFISFSSLLHYSHSLSLSLCLFLPSFLFPSLSFFPLKSCFLLPVYPPLPPLLYSFVPANSHWIPIPLFPNPSFLLLPHPTPLSFSQAHAFLPNLLLYSNQCINFWFKHFSVIAINKNCINVDI